MPDIIKSMRTCTVHWMKHTKAKDKDAENGTVVSNSKVRWLHSLCDPSARYSSSLSWLHQTEPLAWQASYHCGPVSCLRSSKQAHGKLPPLCGQTTLFFPSLKLLLEQNCKCCHRSGADLLTLGSQQPLPTHKHHWAKWGWALRWGSDVCFLFVDICGQFWTETTWSHTETYHFQTNQHLQLLPYFHQRNSIYWKGILHVTNTGEQRRIQLFKWTITLYISIFSIY